MARPKANPALVERCCKKATQEGKAYIVAEFDEEERRKQSGAPLSYADTDEFFAFDGYILAICFPGGEVEYD